MRLLLITFAVILCVVGCRRDEPPSADSEDAGAPTTSPTITPTQPKAELTADANSPPRLTTADRVDGWDGWELSLPRESATVLLKMIERGPWVANTSFPFALADYYVELSNATEDDWMLQVFLPNRTDGTKGCVLLGRELPAEYRLGEASVDEVYSFFADLRGRHPFGDDRVDSNAVLSAGDTFELRNRHGTMKIDADSNRKRTYTWDGASRHVFMEARKEPWYEALGLYFPGSGNHWAEHKGVTRGVLGEQTRDFASIDEFETWFKGQKDWYDAQCSADGIVAGWSINTSRQQLNVELWRVTVAGKTPTALPGATAGWFTWTKGK
jgi:hypothetical protein